MLLGPDDPLPERPRRILVHGASGSGKSTLARAIGRALGLPYTELDGLYHGPGWTRLPTFEADVAALIAQHAWVTEWQYRDVRPLLLDRCTLMVWLDLPRSLVMRRVVRRTVIRRVRRTELWNGNREGPLWRVLVDDEHIVRWAWSTWAVAAGRGKAVLRTHPELPVVRLRTPAAVARWRARLGGSSAPTSSPPPQG